MIIVKVTPQILKKAKNKAKELGKLKNSITYGEGNIAGFVGELIVSEYLKGDNNSTFDYDIKKGKIKYEVKTKRCTSPPKPEYDCSVAKTSLHQECDRYVFTRVLVDQGKPIEVYILGWITKKEFIAKARALVRGQIDPSNNFLVKADCYNVRINQLRGFRRKNSASSVA
jgi:hypothetical protein